MSGRMRCEAVRTRVLARLLKSESQSASADERCVFAWLTIAFRKMLRKCWKQSPL